MSTVRVRETTHHGNYLHVREADVPTDLLPEWILECPYRLQAGAVALGIASQLTESGKVDRGWTTWEVLP